MQIVVNHLTRMRHGHICVAGLDLATGSHVRPESRERLTVWRLAKNGGPFLLGGVIDLGRVQPQGRPPMLEDCPVDLRRLRQMAAAEFWEQLAAVARPTLTAIFGPALTVSQSGACTVAPGQGVASLGCLRVSSPPRLFLRPRPDRPPHIRLRFSDGDLDAYAGVTDLRLYTDDVEEPAPDPRRVDELGRWLRRGDDLILGVGLSRLFAAAPDQPPAHWLQVNAIYPAGMPLWEATLDT